MTPRLEQLFREYAAYHRHPTNRLTHKIAIPMIIFHLMAMEDWVKLPVLLPVVDVPLSLGHLSYLLTVGYYIYMHAPLGFLMALLILPAFPLAAITPWWIVVLVAIAGWTIQLAGHSVWEKNRPAFVKNLEQALIGPLYFVAVLCRVYTPRYSAPAAEPTPAA